MGNLYIVVGSRGVVGSQVVERLRLKKKLVETITTDEILSDDDSGLEERISAILGSYPVSSASIKTGLILAHRYRGEDTKRALFNELRISRDFVWRMSKLCAALRVVALGSITGRYVDMKLPEAYHYTKDLQKSIVRQSVRISNLSMNLLELSWFVKYPEEEQLTEYREKITRLEDAIGVNNVPTVGSITDFACSLIESEDGPRGQSIVFDGGYGILQRD